MLSIHNINGELFNVITNMYGKNNFDKFSDYVGWSYTGLCLSKSCYPSFETENALFLKSYLSYCMLTTQLY